MVVIFLPPTALTGITQERVARRRYAPCRRRTARCRSRTWCRSARACRAAPRAAACADRRSPGRTSVDVEDGHGDLLPRAFAETGKPYPTDAQAAPHRPVWVWPDITARSAKACRTAADSIRHGSVPLQQSRRFSPVLPSCPHTPSRQYFRYPRAARIALARRTSPRDFRDGLWAWSSAQVCTTAGQTTLPDNGRKERKRAFRPFVSDFADHFLHFARSRNGHGGKLKLCHGKSYCVERCRAG